MKIQHEFMKIQHEWAVVTLHDPLLAGDEGARCNHAAICQKRSKKDIPGLGWWLVY